MMHFAMQRVRARFGGWLALRNLKFGLFALLATLAWGLMCQEAAALRMIICVIEAIEPVALLSDSGRSIELGVGGSPKAVPAGTVSRAVLLVTQDETGAVALGHAIAPRVRPGEPGGMVEFHKLRAVGGASFQEGPAVACYFAEETFRGRVVRRWSKCVDVYLLQDVGSDEDDDED